jgi:hypothetical protein
MFWVAEMSWRLSDNETAITMVTVLYLNKNKCLSSQMSLTLKYVFTTSNYAELTANVKNPRKSPLKCHLEDCFTLDASFKRKRKNSIVLLGVISTFRFGRCDETYLKTSNVDFCC